MKHTLRILGCLLAMISATSLQAQQPGNRSRLELGRSPDRKSLAAKTPVIHSRNFPFLKHPAAASFDRPVTVSKNTPLNEYYRSLLIAAPTAVTRPVAVTAAQEAVAAHTTTLTEIRPAAEVAAKGDERMFANEQIVVSNIYPNPATDAAQIDYQLANNVGEAKLILLNVLGAPVAEYALAHNDRKVRIPTRDMATGVYFYQLSVDGRKVATKKLLVRHQ